MGTENVNGEEIVNYMSAAPPQISCIISTYNDAQYVKKKMEEILAQSFFEQAEFIFVETASPERERDLISPYVEKFSNIRLIATDQRLTLYQAWNKGWDAARADLVCYSNMDDAMHPALLETVVNTMQAHPDWDLGSVLVAQQRENSPGARDSFDLERLKSLKLCRRPGPFSVWRKRIEDKMGRFDGHYRIIGDKEFWARAAAADVKMGLISKVLYLYTIAENQLSKRKNKDDERIYTEEKGVKLVWPVSIVRSLVWHRRLFNWFPARYLIKSNETTG